MKNIIIISCIVILLASCSGKTSLSDAYGNFETIEYLVSSEGQGRILQLSVEEGMQINEGMIAGLIDTVPLDLQRQQLQAKWKAVEAGKANVYATISVQESQMKILLKEKIRLEKLLADGAATQKQMDDMDGQISILNSQVNLTKSQLAAIEAELNATRVQILQVSDQIRRNMVINPVKGTVLEKFAENFEIAMPGRALYKIADLDKMILRVYISGDQLPGIRIGQEVTVLIDQDKNSNQQMKGRVSWISGKAEFTPKIIQTKEERVNLVYAVKIEVENDGRLKIGMPGEVIL